MIVDVGSELVISDWKTARSRWSREQAEDASEQLLLYAELAKDFAPDKPVRLEFVILTKSKDVAVDRHSLPADPAGLAGSSGSSTACGGPSRAGASIPRHRP